MYRFVTRTLALFILYLFPFTVTGQSVNVDSIIQHFDTLSNTAYELKAVGALSRIWQSDDEQAYEKFLGYLTDRFAEEDNGFGQRTLQNFYATKYTYEGEYELAKQASEKGIAMSKEAADTLNWGSTLGILGNCFYFQGKYFEAID